MKNREMSVSVTHFTKSPGHGLVADTIRQAGRRWTECTDNWKEDSNRNPKLSFAQPSFPSRKRKFERKDRE